MTRRHWQRDSDRWAFRVSICLAAGVALLWPGSVLGAIGSQAPALTLEPERGPCATELVVRGANFPPGETIALTSRAGREDIVFQLATPLVATDGTFAVRVALWQMEPTCRFPRERRVAGENLYTILATVGGDRPGTVLARATFTLTEAAESLPGLPNTGGGGLAGQPWPPAWGASLAVLLAALGGVFMARPRPRRGE